MATPVVYTVGELVEYKEKFCKILAINRNTYGWNDYILEDIRDSKRYRAHKGEIMKMQDLMTPMEFDVEIESEMEENVETPKSRFPTLESTQIDEIAEGRIAKNTSIQTKWAIKILRGNQKSSFLKKKCKYFVYKMKFFDTLIKQYFNFIVCIHELIYCKYILSILLVY